MPAVLGISALYHDSAAALVVDGEIVAAAQEERFSRRKHDARMPISAVEYCLAEAGLTPCDLDLVGFYEKPLLKFDRVLETFLAHAPRGYRSFARTMPTWLSEKLQTRRAIRKLVAGYKRRIAFLEHHQSHAASAFFPSPFERAAVLTLDGVGEWATGSYGVGMGQHVRLLATQSFPHSVGLLYSAFTAFCGFEVNSGEYKLMGLAPYGEPRFKKLITEKLVDIRHDGSIALDLSYFDFEVGCRTTNTRFAALFGGPARRPEAEITDRELDLAASIQAVINEIVVRAGKHVRDVTGERNLCIAGGVALNCVATRQLIDEQVFDDLWIQPAAGDAGGALGVALALTHSALGVERRVVECRSVECREHPNVAAAAETTNRPAEPKFSTDRIGSQKGSLWGPSFSDDEIMAVLDDARVMYQRFDSTGEFDAVVAKHLDDGAVVAWFQGRMEFGPRALGSRSLLGDARRADLQAVINSKIKFRESFRPFAPAVLAEYARDYFDFGPTQQALDPHHAMLATVGVAAHQLRSVDSSAAKGIARLHQARSTIPAVTHVDNSARVQVVSRERHARFWSLLEAFRRRTGCPVLINTSFNVRGEPIVCTPVDAVRCFAETGIDVLAIGNCLVTKPNANSDQRHE